MTSTFFVPRGAPQQIPFHGREQVLLAAAAAAAAAASSNYHVAAHQLTRVASIDTCCIN